MTEKHPARAASMRSRECVHNHDREGWLALFAEHAVIEDPIGISPIDPTGNGHRTPAERETFWDRNIANSDISITVHKSYSVGAECANILTLDIVLDMGGQKLSQTVNGVFTYAVDDAGLITALRGFWELEEMYQTMKQL